MQKNNRRITNFCGNRCKKPKELAIHAVIYAKITRELPTSAVIDAKITKELPTYAVIDAKITRELPIFKVIYIKLSLQLIHFVPLILNSHNNSSNLIVLLSHCIST